MLYMKNKLRNCHGFTIVELLVTLFLTVMVIATLGSFFLNHLRSYHESVDQVNVQDQVQAAMDLFMEKAMETKGITAPLSLPGANPYIVTLREIDGTSLIFRYDPSLHQLKWGIGEATNIVAGKITSFQVDPVYPNKSDGTPGDDLAQVSSAGVTITVSGTDSGISGPPQELSLNNSVRFRNYDDSP